MRLNAHLLYALFKHTFKTGMKNKGIGKIYLLAKRIAVGELPHIYGEVWNYAVQAKDMNVTTSGVFKARPNAKEGVGYTVNSITANDGFALDFGSGKYSNNIQPSYALYRFRRIS